MTHPPSVWIPWEGRSKERGAPGPMDSLRFFPTGGVSICSGDFTKKNTKLPFRWSFPKNTRGLSKKHQGGVVFQGSHKKVGWVSLQKRRAQRNLVQGGVQRQGLPKLPKKSSNFRFTPTRHGFWECTTNFPSGRAKRSLNFLSTTKMVQAKKVTKVQLRE